MDEQVKLTELECELQSKISEINQLKQMLMVEIDSMHNNEEKKRQVFTQASKLVECVTYTREVIGVFRGEIMRLPAMLGEQVAATMVRIKEGFAKQRSGMGLEIERLRGELAVKSKENRQLQQQIDELTQQLSKMERASIQNYVVPNFQQTSTDEVCDRSPAIEYPAGVRLDTITEDDQIIVLFDQYKNKCKIRQSQNRNIVKTEPPQDNPKPETHTKHISYRKIDVKPRSKSYIQDFRHIVQGNTKCPNPNFFQLAIYDNNQMSQSKISNSKSIISDVSSQYGGSVKTEQPKKHSFQQSRDITPPSVIELGGGMRRSSKDMRRQSKQKIQVTQKQRIKSELADKDCNVIVNRMPSKEKIKITLKEQDLKKSLLNQSKLTKSSFQTPYKQQTLFKEQTYHPYPQLQEQLKKLDLYLGDRKTEQRYEGTKKEGVRWGKGRLEYVNGLVYQGDFKDNLRHGYGILTLNGKKIYIGEWQRDQLCGKGTLWSVQFVNKRKLPEESLLKNCMYDGYFDNNQFQGEGSLQLSNGDRIVGLFNSGLIRGEYNYCRSAAGKEIGLY